MPIYQFKCKSCDFEMEKILPFKDMDSKQFCPKCEEETQRQITLPAPPAFKGSGWTPKHYSLNDVANASASDLEQMT